MSLQNRVNSYLAQDTKDHKFALADNLSCPKSRDTANVTSSCPKTEKEWRKAAEKKNCSSFDQFCSESSKLEYHCVINPFVNQLMEVCASTKNILFGYCTEYNIGGNTIQGNSKTNCSAFIQSPCPIFYPSNEAYKYPGCYDLVENLSIETNTRSISMNVGSSGLTYWFCLFTCLFTFLMISS